MSDEEKNKIVSQPPPPTDEIDGEWGEDNAAKGQPAPPKGEPARAAEASTPPEMKAAKSREGEAEEEDESDDSEAEEEEESTEDEDETSDDEDDDEDEHEDAHARPQAVAPSSDWLPDWAPYAVLAALVSLSVLIGLGLVGSGGKPQAEEGGDKAAEPAKAPTKAAAKPGSHP